MYDFSNVQKANSEVLEKRSKLSLSTYEIALTSLEKFNKNRDINTLRQASLELINSIQHNKEHPQSYFLIGYIFYILDNNEFALKYIQKGESFLQETPEEIISFKKDIEKNISYLNKTNENINNNIQMPQQVKVLVPKKSSFWKLLSGK